MGRKKKKKEQTHINSCDCVTEPDDLVFIPDALLHYLLCALCQTIQIQIFFPSLDNRKMSINVL